MTQDLPQHIALLEQAIAVAFVNDGLPAHLFGGIQGPHMLTFASALPADKGESGGGSGMSDNEVSELRR